MKLFVNHCGLQGILEAAWNSVPIVCMPVINDAEDTMLKAVAKGIGLCLNKETLTSESVLKAVKEVIKRKKYKNNAKKMSAQMRDTPISAIDRAGNFLEYLIRHDGAKHLQLSKEKISFVEYFYLDVFVIVLLFSVILGLSFYTVLRKFIPNGK